MSDDAVTDLTRGVYRRLYAGFTKGQRINRLSLPAEAWFWRVLATVDDFGNGDADPELCRAMTAGRRKVTAGQVGKWLDEMNSVGLISFYEVKGERYLHVLKFPEWQPAGKNGKRFKRFPSPDESGGIQVNPVPSSASENTNKNTTHNENTNDPPFHGEVFLKTLADFEQHRKEIRHKLTPESRKRLYASFLKWGEVKSIEAMETSMEKGWRGVFEPNGNGSRPAGNSKTEQSLAAAGRVAAKYEQQS